MKQAYLLLSLNLFILISCGQEQENTITIDNAWIREAPPNATAMAGYLKINNNTKQERMLTFAKSEQFKAIELHRTSFVDGVAKMRRHNQIPIPAESSLELKPGDFHLMMFKPKLHLKSGDQVTITLGILDGGEIEEVDVIMQVKKS